MELRLRPYATAGVALVGASVIAITPVAPPTSDIRVANPAVQLSASVDPVTPWLEVFDNSAVNFAGLANAWLEAPAPILQQVIANQIGYLSELPDFPVIIGQMLGNLEAALAAPFAIDPDTLESTNPLLSHRSLWTILSALEEDGSSPIPSALQPLLNFSTSYTSGILLGLVGPVIGPILALAASVTAIVENLTGAAPDLEAAFSTLINTPAVMADAFLNGGQTLDVTPVLDALGLSLDLPATEVNGVGITFGGLLSPGGSIFNALDFDITIAGFLDVHIPGNGPGAIGSIIGLSQAIAKAIGWDGTGNPLAPPLDTPGDEEGAEGQDAISRTSLLKSNTVTVSTEGLDKKGAAAADDTTSALTVTKVTAEAEAPTAVEEAESEEGLAADESEQATAKASNNQHQVTRNGPGKQIAGGLKAATERISSNLSKLGKRPGKASETKTGPNRGSTAKSSTKTSDKKSSDKKSDKSD